VVGEKIEIRSVPSKPRRRTEKRIAAKTLKRVSLIRAWKKWERWELNIELGGGEVELEGE